MSDDCYRLGVRVLPHPLQTVSPAVSFHSTERGRERRTRTIGLLATLLFLFGMSVMGQEAKVRTSISSQEPWVGQRITLVVELLAPGYFAGAPAFDLPDPPGMLLLPPDGSPVIGSEDIEGVSYTVQRHELSVFAQRGGAQVIPPFAVRFAFKRQPLDKEVVRASVQTEALQFSTRVPPGTEKLGSVIAARDLKVVETWQPEPGPAKAGDAFTRTIVFTAPDVPAMAFPPVPVSKIDGLGIYPKPPEVLDRSERGTLTGQRRDTVTYVCQRPGKYAIPAVRWRWWDLDAQKLQTVQFPPCILEVAPNPAMLSGAEAAPTENPGDVRALITGSVLAIGLNLLVLVLARRLSFWIRLSNFFRPVRLVPLNPRSRETSRIGPVSPAEPSH